MNKIAIMLYGFPGSGKGTQANFLAEKLALVHFDTGKVLEAAVHDPKRQKDPIIARERNFFDTGKLMTPEFVSKELQRHARQIAKAGLGVVFSGSPRTIGEAHELVPLLEELYGTQHVYACYLDISSAESIRRNSARLICRECSRPFLSSYYPKTKPTHCPVCGGTLYKRTLDNPGVIKTRQQEFEERTKPILKYLKSRGYSIKKFDGSPAPFALFKKLYGYVQKQQGN
jgi:adenylate kinase